MRACVRSARIRVYDCTYPSCVALEDLSGNLSAAGHNLDAILHSVLEVLSQVVAQHLVELLRPVCLQSNTNLLEERRLLGLYTEVSSTLPRAQMDERGEPTRKCHLSMGKLSALSMFWML